MYDHKESPKPKVMYDHKESPKPKITNLSHRHQQVLVVQAKGMLPPYAAAVDTIPAAEDKPQKVMRSGKLVRRRRLCHGLPDLQCH